MCKKFSARSRLSLNMGVKKMDAINHHLFSGLSLPRDAWRPSFNACHQTTFDDRSPGVPGAVFINYFSSQGSVFQRLLFGLQLTIREVGFSCLEVITVR
ncbi:hypothetical protein CDAR_106031 [Caerostris darwini]|uniref:Uncharacterized protein n=1 Tax=Caerostris darwini TaxID=1538125 RepID=A0AAV4TTN0_9ARAC|nr:hypothetical protein CDAR_106031 [Caerostris darwini]